MNCFFIAFNRLLRLKKRLLSLFLVVGILSLLPVLSACKKKIDYFAYVSELRNNVFLYEDEQFSLRIYSITKESPYAANGIVAPLNTRSEVRLLAPSGEKTCLISFTADGKTYDGEMSFDNVKSEYFYAYPIDISHLSCVDVTITYGEQTLTCKAQSVLEKDTLSPKHVLQTVLAAEGELFAKLTDKYGFAGEIYMRLLYEDAPYYYLGVIDREGNTTAFLINATSGKILAKRQS